MHPFEGMRCPDCTETYAAMPHAAFCVFWHGRCMSLLHEALFSEGMMTSIQKDKYRKMLHDFIDRTGNPAAGLTEQVRTPTGGESAGGISNAPLHLGDIGSEAYNQELGVTLLENETYLHDEALAALERLNHVTFGQCESCH